MVVRKSAWSYENNVCKVQVADRQESLDEGDSCVTGSNDHNSAILDNLWLTQKSLSCETQCEWTLSLILGISVIPVHQSAFVFIVIIFFGDVSFMIPLLVKEMRESSASHMNKFMEYLRNDCSVMDLKVQASVSREPKELFEDIPCAFFKNGVHYWEDESSVGLPLVFVEQDRVLDVEMRLVVLKIHLLGKYKGSHHLIIYLRYESHVWRVWVKRCFIELVENFVSVVKVRK